jgi:hypothetical protein
MMRRISIAIPQILTAAKTVSENVLQKINIVTCYLRSQPIERFVAGQQLRRYATVLETLLGDRPRVTMEVQLEVVFCMWSVPRSYLEDTWGELPVVSFKCSC